MRTLGLATLVTLIALAVPRVRADEGDDAIATVKAGIKAHGGEEALKKNKAGEFKMKGSMSILGADLEYTGTMAYQLPDQFKATIDTSLMGQALSIAQIVNGDKFKTTLNGQAQPLDDRTKAELRQGAASQEIAMLYPLLNKEKYTIKAGKDAKIGDVDCSTVLVEGKSTKAIKLHFDKKTGLLHATVRQAIAPGVGNEVEEVTVMSDFKAVDGVQTPMKLVVKHDGKVFMSTTLSDAKTSVKLDPKVFSVDD